jgi:hypothetical protein
MEDCRTDNWIPISKELPNNGMRVIVCLEGGFVCESYRKGEKWERYKNGSFEELMGQYVTYWQPLPSPPKY